MATNSNDGDGPVAVVAVHGLGDQQAGESVRKIADLLLRVRASGRQVYAEFKEVRLRIATHPVEAKRPQTEFGALGVGLRDLQQQSREPLQEGQEDQEDPAHEFMCSQLAGYTGSGNPYETVKLEGRRKNGPPVHLFELHWADLSRIREGLLGTLAAFYQLILHIPNLGWLAIDHALLEHPGCGRWQCYAKVHARAVRVFLILPIVMVLMPLTLLTLLAEALPATWLRVVAIGVPAVAALLLCGRAMYRTRQMRFGALRWVLLPLLALALPSGLLWLLLRSDWVTESQLVAIGWVLVAALPFHYMLGKYDKQQPGVQKVGRILYALLLFLPVLIFLFMGARTWDEIERNILWLFEGQLIVTGLLAFALYLAGLILAGLAGSSLVKHWRKKSRSLAHRAAWTSLATLGIAMPGLWITTLLLGFAAHVAISPLLSAKPHTAFLNRVWRIDEDLPRPEFVEELLYKAAGSGFVVVIGTLAILAIVVVWTLGPSVASENLSQQDGVAKSSNRSQRLGSWVSRAYPAIGLTFMLLFVVGFIVMPTISLLVAFRVPVPGLASLPSASRTLLAGTAGALAASAVGLWALNTRLARVIEPLRPFIDVALDTDSYLWQFPREETPKALIAERFASLLRHLSLWRDDDGRGYRAIVFVAHSQGTVLTADTLAFLCREGNLGLIRFCGQVDYAG